MLQQVITLIDEVNSQDPNQEYYAGKVWLILLQS